MVRFQSSQKKGRGKGLLGKETIAIEGGKGESLGCVKESNREDVQAWILLQLKLISPPETLLGATLFFKGSHWRL